MEQNSTQFLTDVLKVVDKIRTTGELSLKIDKSLNIIVRHSSGLATIYPPACDMWIYLAEVILVWDENSQQLLKTIFGRYIFPVISSVVDDTEYADAVAAAYAKYLNKHNNK